MPKYAEQRESWSFPALGNFKISVWNNLSLGIRFSLQIQQDPTRIWNRLMIKQRKNFKEDVN